MFEPRINVYHFTHYKECINAVLSANSGVRGLKGIVAKHLRCQSSFISQVLHRDDRHFSAEHIFAFCELFSFTEDAADYLLMLLSKDRAGTDKLRAFYINQIEKTRLTRQRIKADQKPIKGAVLSEEQLAIFHSHWYNFAVYRVLSQSPHLSEVQLAVLLDLSTEKIRTAISTLKAVGLIVNPQGSDDLQVAEGNLYVGRATPYVDHIHRNFRIEALKSLDKRKIEDAHYSNFLLVSKSRIAELQDRIAKTVGDLNAFIDEPLNPKDEKALFGFCVDCFRY